MPEPSRRDVSNARGRHLWSLAGDNALATAPISSHREKDGLNNVVRGTVSRALSAFRGLLTHRATCGRQQGSEEYVPALKRKHFCAYLPGAGFERAHIIIWTAERNPSG